MYIEFHIDPYNRDPYERYTVIQYIVDKLGVWSDTYQIPFNTKATIKTLRVFLGPDENYTLFGLTWDQIEYTGLISWTLKDPMAPPKNID